MKTNIKNGIYIIDEQGDLHTPEEWAKQSNPTTALSVVLFTAFACIEIAKNDLDGEFKFDEAQKACAALGEGWRCPTRHEAIEMYDARFRGLDEAMQLIGGDPLTNSYWTCEADPDPEYNSRIAFIYYGNAGTVSTYPKNYTSSVRPLSEF
jgi:hypothetical protein